MTYARARLWLGITAVGSVALLSALLLLFRIPARTLPTAPQGVVGDLGAILLALLLYAALHAPFDWFGGWVLPREYRRRGEWRDGETFVRFLLRWFRGALLHGAALFVAATLLLYGARLGGIALAVALFLTLGALQLAFQERLAGWLGAIRSRPAPAELRGQLEPLLGRPLRLLDGDASYLTGGVAGIPGMERVLIPDRWLDTLDLEELHAQALRRGAIVASGAHLRGVLLAFGWNGLGFALAYALAIGGGAVAVADLASLALLSTLWSFLGVLALPSASRAGVFMADAAALRAGADPDALERLLRALDADQDDEPARSPWVERVFHPIPAVEARLQRLESRDGARVVAGRLAAWHTARTALYLSWSGLGLLGRAVHCNCGRPDAWVLLPSD